MPSLETISLDGLTAHIEHHRIVTVTDDAGPRPVLWVTLGLRGDNNELLGEELIVLEAGHGWQRG